MKLAIERLIENDDLMKILLASIVSSITAVMIITSDYQFFKLVQGEFWFNLLKIIGNGIVIAMLVLGIISIIAEVIYRNFLRSNKS